MSTNNITQLNHDFAFERGVSHLRVSPGEGDIPIVEIQNDAASAKISMQGAHVLSWIPKSGEDVIWMSPDASFVIGKSLRGGIPVCWPWFGAHARNNALPAHGFARTVFWQLTDTQLLSDNETQITFQLDTRDLGDRYYAMWPAATVLEYRLTIGRQLSMELITTNHSKAGICIGQALHTYFNISDIGRIRLTGLEHTDYLDKTENFSRKTQKGDIKVDSEIDRVYLDTADDVIIHDQARKITIQKLGSRSTVVWNPWRAVAEKMADLGKDGYRKMLCVESANTADDTVTIAAGDSHSLRAIYKTDLN